MREDSHPSNQDLLLAADGELPAREAARVRAHLVFCWQCRARMVELETTIAEFTRAYSTYSDADVPVPPIDGPRALLAARMRQAASMRQARGSGDYRSWPTLRSTIGAFALLVIAFGALLVIQLRTRHHANASYAASVTPRSSLTPGAIRMVTRDEVCSTGEAGSARSIPASLRQQVFQEYGMPQAKADAFEMDYLVTPELGGAEDIRNIWPQPYRATVWNAHVKDALERRLYEMVCSGEIDLATAQRDIALDWISAYKKYFHTDKPF